MCKRVDYRGNTIATRDKYCEKSTRPKVSTEESCKLMVCPHKVIDKPKWKVSPWSQVSGKLHNISACSNKIKMHQCIKGRCAQLGLLGNTTSAICGHVRRNVIRLF